MATAKADTVGVTLNDLRGTAVTRLALAAYTETEITVSLRGCAIVDAHYLHRNPARSRKTLSGSSKCEGISQLTAQRALDTLVVQGGKPSEINGGRTRTRTWDPLIKSHMFTATFQRVS